MIEAATDPYTSYDVGRAIAAVDSLLEARDQMAYAIVLPFVDSEDHAQ